MVARRGSVVIATLVLTALARRWSPVPKAAVLGVGTGLLFGLQASLTPKRDPDAQPRWRGGVVDSGAY